MLAIKNNSDNSNWIYTNVDDPKKIPSNWAMIEVKAVGLCGSDFQKITTPNYNSSNILGHEISGVVVKCNGHKNLYGKRVVVNPLIGCNKCNNCRDGAYEVCKDISVIGRNISGGFAQYVLAPVDNIYVLSDSVSFEVSTLVDGFAAVLHGYNLLKAKSMKSPIKKILIIGDGCIGLCCAILFSIKESNTNITILGKHKLNLNLIKNIINCHVVNVDNEDQLSSGEFDLVIETVGRSQSETINNSIKLVNSKGIILIYGVFPTNYYGSIYLRELFYKEILLFGSNSYSTHNGINEFDEALKLVTINLDLVKKLITHTFPLKDFMLGVNLMKNKEQNVPIVKIIYNSF